MKNKKTIFLIAGVIFLAIIAIYSLKSPQGASTGLAPLALKKRLSDESPGESDEIVKILSMLSRVDFENRFFETSFF